MTTTSLSSARYVRDGGIDAMAALDDALGHAIVGLPARERHELKVAFGQIMGEITVRLINPTLSAFPELKLDEASWAEVARARAAARLDAV
jgi:hypothetical protein